jgi:rubrerythrin
MNTTDINELIDFAITLEHAAYDFYKSAAEKVDNPGVKDLFLELAQDENGHANLLEMYRDNKAIGELFEKEVVDYKITETQEAQELLINMKPAEAIIIAMKREQEAANMYKAMAKVAATPKIKKTLERLANMEMGHKHKLENAFVDIGYPEVF